MPLSLDDLKAIPQPGATPPTAPTPTSTPVAPPPDAAAQSAGATPPALNGSAAPMAITAPPQRVAPAPRDRSALDNMANAVDLSESGGEHLDKNGNVKQSNKGAIGRMGLMPDTAKDLGVNPTDEKQNLAAGKQYLGQMFDRYQNWDDALAAYNWGPGNVDKWIARGKDPDKMPAETRAYIASTFRRAGMSVDSPTSVVAAKRGLTAADLEEIPQGDVKPDSQTSVSPRRDVLDDLREPFKDIPGLGYVDETMHATAVNMTRGMRNLMAGPVQAGLEQGAPELAKQFTEAMNQYDNQFEELNNKHPWAAQVGDVVGTVLGIAVGAKALAPMGAAIAARTALPATVGRYLSTLGGSAALSATTFHPDDNHMSRIVEGGIGAVLGGMFATVGRAVMYGARNMADTTTYKAFIEQVSQAVGDLTPSTTKLKSLFLPNYEAKWAHKNANYTVRNAFGEQIDGFPYEEMARSAKDAIAGSREAGVAPSSQTQATARKVAEELGVAKREVARAEHQRKIDEYDSAVKLRNEIPIGGRKLSDMPEAERAVMTRRLDEAGALPPVPEHPGEFVAEPIKAEEYSAARTAINAAIGRAKNDVRTRTQLTAMLRNMDRAAKDTASEAGMSADAYLRAQTEANDYYKRNIAPIQKIFGKPEDVRGDPTIANTGITNAKFFDQAVKMIEGHDMEALRAYKEIMGREAQPELIRIGAYRMLTSVTEAAVKGSKGGDVTGAKAMKSWITDHREAIQELMGREGVEQMRGMAAIAERIAARPLSNRNIITGTLGHHPWLGGLMILEGIRHGAMGTVALGGGILALQNPAVQHIIFNGLNVITKIPTMAPIIRRAAKTKPDSPEMDRIMQEIDRRVKWGSAATARATVQPGPGR